MSNGIILLKCNMEAKIIIIKKKTIKKQYVKGRGKAICIVLLTRILMSATFIFFLSLRASVGGR